jgi:hypothetical protein
LEFITVMVFYFELGLSVTDFVVVAIVTGLSYPVRD